MKPNARPLIWGLFALVLVSVACANNVFATEEVTIIGTVYAEAWDDNGNATAAVIVGTEGEYNIVKNATGTELFKLNYKDVKVSGIIGEDSEGNKTITVTDYEILPE
jgi:hypothetical protein